MSTLESDPTRASLIVHRDGLFGLMRGLDIATDKIDRLVTKDATLPELGNAVLDSVAALNFVAIKLEAMADLIAAAVEQTPKGTECLTGIVAGLQAKLDAEMAQNPPPVVEKPCAKVLQGPWTRRRIEHGGHFGGDAA